MQAPSPENGLPAITPIGPARPSDSKKYSHVNILEFKAAARDAFKEDPIIPELDIPVDISSDPVQRVIVLISCF